ncbi:MAG: hypothetical protein ACXVQJ_05680 [Actinomycetota bacterium]
MTGIPPTDWEALRALMATPKPPLTCTGYAIGKEPLKVRLDGAGRCTRVQTGEDLAGESWLTSALEPARFATLATAKGLLTGTEVVAGRPCTIAEVQGLRGGKTPVRTWVDDATGCIVRMERTDDPAPLVVVEDLRIEG